MRYSQFSNSLLWRIDQLYAATHQKTTIEQVIQRRNGEVAAFQESVRITDFILKKIRRRVAPQIPIYVFETDNTAPYHQVLQELLRANGMIFLDGIPDALQHAQQQGVMITAHDGIHWNEAGHALVAKELEKRLR